ncbi:MAG TPA: hypothetical protein VKW06_00720 [Candidatus Angelobacter sp.]|nr:hypothetical protein [Candidatus Angelobacter sp.]
MKTFIEKQIARIDRQINMVRQELKKRVGLFDEMSAQAWQEAWDIHPDLRQRESLLFTRRGQLQSELPEPETLELHSHTFVSGPRSKSGYGKDGKWHECGEKISHSHTGGSVPHRHEHTGPSFYGYRKPKVTQKPKGEYLEIVAIPDEEQSFDLVITDTARLGGVTPIGDTPIEDIHMMAADVMQNSFRLKCNVRDDRVKK